MHGPSAFTQPRVCRVFNNAGLQPGQEGAPMKTTFGVLISLITVVLLLTAAALGQAVYGNILGTVTDASGAALGNATVSVTDLDRGQTYKTTSNESGNYEQTHLLAGH